MSKKNLSTKTRATDPSEMPIIGEPKSWDINPVISNDRKGFDPYKWRAQRKLVLAPFRWKTSKCFRVTLDDNPSFFRSPLGYIDAIFKTMRQTARHTFQVITWNPSNFHILNQSLWAENIWLGISIRSFHDIPTINALRDSSAKVKFLLIEDPYVMLSTSDLSGIDYVCVGQMQGANNA